MKQVKNISNKMGFLALLLFTQISKPVLAQDSAVIGDIGSGEVAESVMVGIGDITKSGTACWASADHEFPLVITETTLRLPLGLMVKQSAGVLKRGSCVLSIPIILPQGYRAIVANSKVEGFMNLAQGSRVRTSVEIFKPGLQSKAMKSDLNALDSRLKQGVMQQEQGEIFTTDCGEQFNLRVNSSAILEGQARSTLRLDYLDFDLILEQCN